MNPKDIQEMLAEIQEMAKRNNQRFGNPSESIQRTMEDVQRRMDQIFRDQEEMQRNIERRLRELTPSSSGLDRMIREAKARPIGGYRPTQPLVNPIPPSQRTPAYPKPDPIEDAKRAERIKKEEEEWADKERRSKIPGGFDIWDD
jgi:Arc/MetJ-type ribon-helix-helix transcriptional regulator